MRKPVDRFSCPLKIVIAWYSCISGTQELDVLIGPIFLPNLTPKPESGIGKRFIIDYLNLKALILSNNIMNLVNDSGYKLKKITMP